MRQAHIIAEYYYNGLGLDNNDYALFKEGIRTSLDGNRYQSPNVWQAFLLTTHTNYDLAKFRQNYFFFRLSKDKFWKGNDIELSSFWSVADGGVFLLPKFTHHVSETLDIYAKLYMHLGPKESEFRWYYENFIELSATFFL